MSSYVIFLFLIFCIFVFDIFVHTLPDPALSDIDQRLNEDAVLMFFFDKLCFTTTVVMIVTLTLPQYLLCLPLLAPLTVTTTSKTVSINLQHFSINLQH